MIIVKLIGGLGNQMFQYAAGKALATRLQVPLKLDLSDLNKSAEGAYTQRHFELDKFNIRAGIASNEDIQAFLKNKNSKIIRALQRHLPSFFAHVYFAENGNQYMESFAQLKPNTYLDGFWQSELYFKEERTALLKDFTIRESMPDQVKQWYSKIQASSAMAIHVRRGDYVSLPSAAAFHGVCSVDYYQKAFAQVAKNQSKTEVFVFSDDLDWCKANLLFDAPTHYVLHGEAAVWDMFLMSACKDIAIANSSFSWWAAWLNQHTNKRVFVPEYWFSNIQTNAIDILAENWEIIPEGHSH